MAVLLALVTVALYWPATRCDFVNYDDNVYLLENSHVTVGLTWEGVKWAFHNTTQAAYWAPLVWLSHMLACQLFGLNAWGHHLVNVLLHALNTVLVFLLLRCLTSLRRDEVALASSTASVRSKSAAQTGMFWLSVLAAALFGWHPLRVESVAWVTERKDVLSACFGLLSLIFYVRYAQFKIANRQSPIVNYALALLFFALGLMSKPMLVTWPFVMLLLDYWPLGRFSNPGSLLSRGPWPVVRGLVFEKLPFLALAAVASIVTFAVQQQGGAVIAVEKLPLGARVGNALISYCRYLGQTFWPTDLAVFYPHPGHWPLGQVLLAGGLLAGISVLLMVKRQRYPFMLMGWLWFLGTLVPVIGLAQSGEQALADRFTYIPSLGVLILAVWGAYELARRWRYGAMTLSVAGGTAIIVCLVLTRQQLGYWRDSEGLFRHALAVTENNHLAHNNLGTALLERGCSDEAIHQYQEAIRVKPDYAIAHNNLGIVLAMKGRTGDAIRQFQEVIRLKPRFAEAYNNLGAALLEQGQIDEAIRQCREALRLNPDCAGAQNNLGIARGRKNQPDEAVSVSHHQTTVPLKPDNTDAQTNLAPSPAHKEAPGKTSPPAMKP